jgi:hypothetical protein
MKKMAISMSTIVFLSSSRRCKTFIQQGMDGKDGRLSAIWQD